MDFLVTKEIVFFKIHSIGKSISKQICKTSECDVYALNMRCHGDSPAGPLTYSEMTNDLNRFLSEKNIEKASILGHSMYDFDITS